MGFLSKLFGKKHESTAPDNTLLLELIDVWVNHRKEDSYKNVILELQNGNSFLMFPTKNDPNKHSTEWATTEKGKVLSIWSIVEQDGFKILGAFTDEQAMVQWTKGPTEYTAMRSQDVLELCKNNGIDRIVINTGLDNMFVLEWGSPNVRNYKVEEDTKIQMGTPNRPLNDYIKQKLISCFRKNDTILEVYEYGQTMKGEFSIVLAFKLTINSENAKKAATNAVVKVLEEAHLDQSLDLYFIDDDDFLETVKKIDNSLIYAGKRNDELRPDSHRRPEQSPE